MWRPCLPKRLSPYHSPPALSPFSHGTNRGTTGCNAGIAPFWLSFSRRYFRYIAIASRLNCAALLLRL
jgi:hypothetical protein